MMVRFRTIDLKWHLIAQFEENHIICKKILTLIKHFLNLYIHTFTFYIHFILLCFEVKVQ